MCHQEPFYYYFSPPLLEQQYLILLQVLELSNLRFLNSKAVLGMDSISWSRSYNTFRYWLVTPISLCQHCISYLSIRTPLQTKGFVVGLCLHFSFGSIADLLPILKTSARRGEGSLQASLDFSTFNDLWGHCLQQRGLAVIFFLEVNLYIVLATVLVVWSYHGVFGQQFYKI